MPQNRLREIRELRGLSRDKVAEIMNTTSVSIGRYEREDQRLDLPLLSQFSRVLNCTIAQIVGEAPLELSEDAAAHAAPLDRARLMKVIDALDHHLAENKLKIHPGGRADLVMAIYDWTVDQKLPLDQIGDLAGIRSLIRPALTT